MKSFSIHIDNHYGWNKIVHNDYIFWFKGYILDGSISSIAQSLSVFLLKPNNKELSKFLYCIRGHYSFIIHNDDFLISVADKVCSIPLFYTEIKDTLIISNNATIIKDNLSSDNNIDVLPILEISMSGYTIGNKTLYKGIKQLTAGEFISVQNSKLTRQYYHTYSPWKTHVKSELSLKNELTDVLFNVMDRLASSVKGRSIVVPLSAGYDSRLIASGLREVGVKNVLCISYGNKNSFEVLAAKNIAKKLGYDFRHVEYDSNYTREYYNSIEYSKFKSYFNRYNSIEFTQDMSAVSLMHANNDLEKDTIIINGMSGDYISGGHISSIFSQFANGSNIGKYDKQDLFDDAMKEYIKKQYGLWSALANHKNKNKIINSNIAFINARLQEFDINNNIYSIFEFLEFYGRQSKFVLKGQEVYDFYGYEWRLPLWDPVFIDFWESVPLENKYDQRLYKSVLVENNWGGVWSNIPINNKTINPAWIRPVRFILKALLSPLGRKNWHRVEKNALMYWMDNSYESSIYPYKRFLLDNRGHRNMLSFRSEDYIKKHTNIDLESLI